MNPIIISNLDEAITYINGKDSKEQKIQISGDLKYLKIEIEGQHYNGNMTGELARALALFQDEIYKAVRYTVYSPSSRLGAEQKEKFELDIEVKEGCTVLGLDLGKVCEGLSIAIQNMTPAEVNILVVTAILAVGAVWAGKTWIAEHYKSKVDMDGDAQETERLKTVMASVENIVQASRAAQHFSEATSNGIREIATRANNATSVKVGPVVLDETDLANLRAKAPRSNWESVNESGEFRILTIDNRKDRLFMTVAGPVFGVEVDVEVFSEDFEDSQIQQLSNALLKGSMVHLEINAVRKGEKYRSATLVSIGKQDQSK